MVIHSIMPAQAIMGMPEPQEAEMLPVAGGFLEGRRTGRGFEMTRLCSTDPALYLKYSPGGVYGDGQGR